eukprot:4875254-Pleurochrysis_carterae.AAC.2
MGRRRISFGSLMKLAAPFRLAPLYVACASRLLTSTCTSLPGSKFVIPNVATDPFWLVALVTTCTPTANNIVVLCELTGAHVRVFAETISSGSMWREHARAEAPFLEHHMSGSQYIEPLTHGLARNVRFQMREGLCHGLIWPRREVGVLLTGNV